MKGLKIFSIVAIAFVSTLGLCTLSFMHELTKSTQVGPDATYRMMQQTGLYPKSPQD